MSFQSARTDRNSLVNTQIIAAYPITRLAHPLFFFTNKTILLIMLANSAPVNQSTIKYCLFLFFLLYLIIDAGLPTLLRMDK